MMNKQMISGRVKSIMSDFFEKIKQLKYVQWLKHTSLYTIYKYFRDYDKINQMIDKYAKEKIPKKNRRKLQWKMVIAKTKEAWNYDEFFLYHYVLLSKTGRDKFATETQKTNFSYEVNAPEIHELFNNKLKTYEIFGAFYKRDVIPLVGGGINKENFLEFINKHPRFIVKPLNASLGRDVKIIEITSQSNVEKVYTDLNQKYPEGAILEEIIEQNKEISEFHPNSLNTLRISTFKFKEEVSILPCFFRTGRGDSIVDNAGAGGIIAAVDIESGVLLSAADELGDKYIFHPDTGKQIIGYRLPEWEKAKEMAKRLALVVPASRYIGWDLAYTNSGWVMVEGNARAQFVWQIPSQEGFNPELQKIEKRYREEVK